MATGKLKFYNRRKGYGFIRDAGTKREIFVHISDFEFDPSFLKDNDELTYDIKEDVRGMKALHVNKVAKE
jgi:CspA family cold shock protein